MHVSFPRFRQLKLEASGPVYLNLYQAINEAVPFQTFGWHNRKIVAEGEGVMLCIRLTASLTQNITCIGK